MLDRVYIKEHKAEIIENCKNRNVDIDINDFLRLDEERSTLIQEVEELNRAKNENASELKSNPDSREKLIEHGKEIKKSLQDKEQSLREIESKYNEIAYLIPNLTHPSTPIGKDEESNVVIRAYKEPTKFTFEPKDHETLGVALGIIDKETASKVSGARFAYLKGDLALMQFALVQHVFSLLTHRERLEAIAKENNIDVDVTDFIPVIPPTMMKPGVMHKMGRLEPRDERYHIESDDLYLVGSAEHTLGPIHMNTQFTQDQLPLRYIGYSTAYRREAGSYGKDTKGIFRLHQFDKLEIETFSLPEKSLSEQDFIIAIQEHLMQSLELPYRVVQKCTGDMGAPDYREYDIEAWIPSQQTYRETHTSDLMTDYQSRRLNIKVKRDDGTVDLVHMNDATVFAIGRTLIAIIENYQQEDGSILIPEALLPYMFGKTVIS